MTTITALSSKPYITSLIMQRSGYQTPDAIASGFQTQLQNQVRLSRTDSATAKTMPLQQSATVPRSDIDSMLAQLLASRKMLLHTINPACHSGLTNRKTITDCILAYEFYSEMNHPVLAPEAGATLCHQRIKDAGAVKDESECHALTSDNPFICQPPIPAAPVAPLAYIFIWVAPEFVRFPVRYSSDQPLRIRRLRLLNSAGHHQKGNSLKDDDYSGNPSAIA